MEAEAWGLLLLPLTVLLVAVDVMLPVLPSELLVVGSGTLSAEGNVPLPLALLAAATGCWLGDVGLYLLFRYRLTGWLDRFRWGRSLHGGILHLVSRAGKSPTYAAVVAARFISGGRTAAVAAAGLAGVPAKPFLWLSAAGAVLWSGWMVGLGYATGTTTDLPVWVSSLLGLAVGTLAGLVIAGIIGVRRRLLRSKASGPGDGAAP